MQYRVTVQMAGGGGGGGTEVNRQGNTWETKSPKVAQMSTTPKETEMMVGIEGRSQEGSGTHIVGNRQSRLFLTTSCASNWKIGVWVGTMSVKDTKNIPHQLHPPQCM